MHYDGAGPNGWLACLATSSDLIHWEKKGPILDFGAHGQRDSASASYGITFLDGKDWHMFYLGTQRVSSKPNLVPSTPYYTMKAKGNSPTGPWTKQPEVVPFSCVPGTYYSDTASPGQIIKQGDEYLMFFAAAKRVDKKLKRTLGLARTHDLNGAWKVDPEPILPSAEQIENSTLYFEPTNKTWFLFTNHIGLGTREYPMPSGSIGPLTSRIGIRGKRRWCWMGKKLQLEPAVRGFAFSHSGRQSTGGFLRCTGWHQPECHEARCGSCLARVAAAFPGLTGGAFQSPSSEILDRS